jgi:hypothetical protein
MHIIQFTLAPGNLTGFKPTRKISSAQLYTLNRESKTTHAIMTFQKELSNIENEKQVSSEEELLKGESVISGTNKG